MPTEPPFHLSGYAGVLVFGVGAERFRVKGWSLL